MEPGSNNEEERYLTLREAAEVTGRSYRALRSRVDRGTLPYRKGVDGVRRVALSTVVAAFNGVKSLPDVGEDAAVDQDSGIYIDGVLHLTLTEAAALTGRNRKSLKSKIERGTLPSLLVDGLRRVSMSELEKLGIDQAHVSGNRLLGPEKPGVQLSEDSAVIIGPESLAFSKALPNSRELQLLNGFDPDEWEETKSLASWYGDPENPSGQLKVWLTKKKPVEFIFPGRMPATYIAPARPAPRAQDPVFGVVCGDPQVPHNNKGMEDCFLQFLADMQPDELTDVGDQADNPSVSSYAKNPKWHVPLNECIQGTTELNYYRRRACEKMTYRILMGNHDIRLKNFMLNRAESVYGIKRGQIPGDDEYQGSVLDWAYLTHADRLGIEVIGEADGDEYFHGEVRLADPEDGFGLTAEHGSKTGPNASLKTIERLTHSVMFGHTHNLEMRTKTIYDINGDPRTIYVVNTGTMADIRGGIGFSKKPDWVNGFATYMKWPDGRFTIEFAKYENGELFWRDRRWRTNVQG